MFGLSERDKAVNTHQHLRAFAFALAFAFTNLAGCAASIPFEQVSVIGVGSDEFLKLRAGPGLGFRVVLGIPNETKLSRGKCATEFGQLWCQVSLANAPQVKGYVSADYLSDQ